jgi:hypothetical protein
MKKLISITISLLILALIYWQIDFWGLIDVLANSDLLWIIVSLGMVVPITLTTGYRLQVLVPRDIDIGFLQSSKLILLGSVLNMVLPSKMGDIAKAYFIWDTGKLSGTDSLSLVVFEKACDLLSLLLWCVFGLLLYPQKDLLFWGMTVVVVAGFTIVILLLTSSSFTSFFFKITKPLLPGKIEEKGQLLLGSWHNYREYLMNESGRFIKVASLSVFIWFMHLFQIWLFILAINSWTPFVDNLALAPLSILAGLLPITFAGVGTRDAALIFFYQPYMAAPTAAALGLLCTSRYIMPALGGLPFLWKYSGRIKEFRKSQKQMEADF